jgi:predicted phage baseplate assembly protein
MAVEVTRPDFKFAGAYYPELLESLIQYKRQNVPELTDESAYEPFIQFLRMEALIGHLSHVLLDLVANEVFLPTAALAESVRNHLRLIDYDLQPAAPAQADVVFELARAFSVQTEIIPAGTQVGTKQQGATASILYEALDALTIDPSDELSHVLVDESGVFTDYTAKANSQVTPGDDWTPWATPAVGDAIYFGHAQVLWNKLALAITTGASGITGVWEYYDGTTQDTAPTSVAVGGAVLDFDLTSLLGTSERTGTLVRVAFNDTGAAEDVVSTWDGVKNVCQTGLLGQSSPSAVATDYTVGTEWKELSVTDGSADLTVSGDVEFTLPQTLADDWIAGTVEGDEAFWLRYRIVVVSTPTSPVMQYARIDTGKQYVTRLVTQGQTVEDSPLGSSDGTADQEFETSRDYYLDGTMRVWVLTEEWSEVSDFLNSTGGDRHFVVELGENDRATVQFGNGASGRIPPTGANNIRCEYRIGGDVDGNVGANQITVDKSGLSFVNKLWNPRQATGWTEGEGASETSLERAKIAGPATLRTKDVAIGPDDVITLTQSFEDDSGARPFSRARAFEEGLGPKTIELVVVAAGGGAASAAQLAALNEYFNGDPYASPPKEKHIVANQEVTAVNYAQRVIDITATVAGDVTVAEVENRLLQVIQPEALKEDGITYEWEFGGRVPVSRIIHEIFGTDESITDVDVTVPAIDVELLDRELPVVGTLSITIA